MAHETKIACPKWLPSKKHGVGILFCLIVSLLSLHWRYVWTIYQKFGTEFDILKTTEAVNINPEQASLLDQCKGPFGLPQAKPIDEFDLTRAGPFIFLPEYRNPCWRRKDIHQLRCLPYFYLAGFQKCGTTDLYERILRHPNVTETPTKEPLWMAARRFFASKPKSNIDYYTNFFAKNLNGANKKHYVVGDASVNLAWKNEYWYNLPGNENCSEPAVINADYVRYLTPDAKIIMMMRKPSSRLWSHYTYFSRNNKAYKVEPEKFHALAEQQKTLFENCVKDWSVRNCAYNYTLFDTLQGFQIGLYVIFLKDWLLRFPPDQILILRTEDILVNVTKVMEKVFQFLNLGEVDSKTMKAIEDLKKQHVTKFTTKAPTMLEKTRVMLDNFYRPFNQELADLLGDKKYTWEDL